MTMIRSYNGPLHILAPVPSPAFSWKSLCCHSRRLSGTSHTPLPQCYEERPLRPNIAWKSTGLGSFTMFIPAAQAEGSWAISRWCTITYITYGEECRHMISTPQAPPRAASRMETGTPHAVSALSFPPPGEVLPSFVDYRKGVYRIYGPYQRI